LLFVWPEIAARTETSLLRAIILTTQQSYNPIQQAFYPGSYSVRTSHLLELSHLLCQLLFPLHDDDDASALKLVLPALKQASNLLQYKPSY
jgi:hypothetical protein